MAEYFGSGSWGPNTDHTHTHIGLLLFLTSYFTSNSPHPSYIIFAEAKPGGIVIQTLPPPTHRSRCFPSNKTKIQLTMWLWEEREKTMAIRQDLTIKHLPNSRTVFLVFNAATWRTFTVRHPFFCWPDSHARRPDSWPPASAHNYHVKPITRQAGALSAAGSSPFSAVEEGLDYITLFSWRTSRTRERKRRKAPVEQQGPKQC